MREARCGMSCHQKGACNKSQSSRWADIIGHCLCSLIGLGVCNGKGVNLIERYSILYIKKIKKIVF